jgi:hypothetical protein
MPRANIYLHYVLDRAAGIWVELHSDKTRLIQFGRHAEGMQHTLHYGSCSSILIRKCPVTSEVLRNNCRGA